MRRPQDLVRATSLEIQIPYSIGHAKRNISIQLEASEKAPSPTHQRIVPDAFVHLPKDQGKSSHFPLSEVTIVSFADQIWYAKVEWPRPRYGTSQRHESALQSYSQVSLSGLSNVDGFTTLIMVITFDHAAIGRQDHRRRPAGNDAYPAPVCTLMRRSSDLTGKLTTCLTVLAEQACFITAWTVSI
ncbi:hypothetical protein T4E_7152 [Trichinella pseudospiralis]|uniref:Uncharacterized protein n=1 Tax=Trichinella pseudospiralis TaxID=6337 RepID=A0A0V0YH55_TRIPS|nr:hypothetical protein T4E_7152 [Trichinella pseudospiralis]